MKGKRMDRSYSPEGGHGQANATFATDEMLVTTEDTGTGELSTKSYWGKLKSVASVIGMKAKYTLRNSEAELFIIQPEEAQAHIKHAMKCSHFLPDEPLMCYIDALIVLIMLYYGIVAPLRSIIELPDSLNIVEWIFTVILALDIVRYAFCMTMVNAEVIEDNSWRILAGYIRGFFAWDVVAAIPADLILRTSGHFPWVNYLRLAKYVRFNTWFKESPRSILTPHYVFFFYDVLRYARTIIFLCLLFHWLAVVHHAVQRDKEEYVTSLYFVVYTFTSVGYGDVITNTAPQKIFAMVVCLIGLLGNAFIVGELVHVYARSNIHEDKKNKIRETLAFVRYFRMPYELQKEVLSFQSHLLNCNATATFSDLVVGLPVSMQQHIGLYVRIKLIASVQMFTLAEQACQAALAQRLHSIVYAPGQRIIEADTVGKEMFFLGHGFADITSKENLYITTVKKGGFFGEIALLLDDAVRTAHVTALTYCDLFRLDKEDFLAILEMYPSFKESIEAEIKRRFHHSTRRNSVAPSSRATEEETALMELNKLKSISDGSRYHKSFEVSEPPATRPHLQSYCVPVVRDFDDTDETHQVITPCKSAAKLHAQEPVTLVIEGEPREEETQRDNSDMARILREVQRDVINRLDQIDLRIARMERVARPSVGKTTFSRTLSMRAAVSPTHDTDGPPLRMSDQIVLGQG